MVRNKKTKILVGIGIFTLLLTIIGAAYAYFTANLGGGTGANINASTGTTDSLTFDAGDPISIHASLENFAEGMESLKGSTTATATLKANNTTNQATSKYNIFFIIDDNDFVYSTVDGQAELLLKVTDPNGKEVEDITGLKRVENGFDITTRTGGFLIRADYEIETTSTIEQTWNIEVTLVNLDANQNVNNGKSFHGKFYITTEQLNTYEIAKINSVETNTTYNSITANLNTMAGSSEIEKYYYAIEEDTSAVALLGFSNGILRTSSIAAKELNYIESDEPTHTFDNLKPNTSYKVYSYAKDKEGINSNVYKTSITTDEYALPKVTGLTHTSELYKITVTATSERGSNEVSKYYFSKDNGVTWSEGQESPTYVFDNLLDTTTYNIKVKVSDTENKYSTEYYEAIATSTYINPSITTVTNTKNYNSITLTATASKGTNNISKYYFSKDNGSTWSEGQTSNEYTFTGLNENTEYNIKVKVEDTNGRMSNPYSLDVTTNTYRVPSVSATTTKTGSSITISSTGTAGDGNIAKYMYSKDGGSNWVTNSSAEMSNSYTFSGLTSGTSYNIKIKVVDSNNRESSVYSLSVTTNTTLVTKVKSLYTSQGSNGIYYHTTSLANSAGDNSYRFAGENPNNYVCFYTSSGGCSIQGRIIGVFGNQVKLRIERSMTIGISVYWSGTAKGSNIWSESTLNKETLNGKILDLLGDSWKNVIPINTWYVGGLTRENGLGTPKNAYNYELGSNKNNTTYQAKVGMVYVSEYAYSATSSHWTKNLSDYGSADSWMKASDTVTLLTRLSTDNQSIFAISKLDPDYAKGDLKVETTSVSLGFSPTIVLPSTISIIEGEGTKTSPYKINVE